NSFSSPGIDQPITFTSRRMLSESVTTAILSKERGWASPSTASCQAPPGGVAGEAVVEHVDEADLRTLPERVLHRRGRDRVVVGRFDLANGLKPDDTVGKPLDQLDHREKPCSARRRSAVW